MIENFDEKHAPELEKEDERYIDMFYRAFLPKIGKENKITNEQIRQKVLLHDGTRLTPAKVRTIIHEVRIRHFPDLLASSKGYWRASSMEEVKEYYRGLNRRIRSQQHILAAGTHYIMSNQNKQL